MDERFKFTVLVNETDEVEVEIPETLHQEVSSRFDGQLERMEFGFPFFETVKHGFPALHQLIQQTIDRQLQLGGDSVYYSLASDWFEE